MNHDELTVAILLEFLSLSPDKRRDCWREIQQTLADLRESITASPAEGSNRAALRKGASHD